MDAKYYNGDDERDSLTQRAPDRKATYARSCCRCGVVVYAGADHTVLCRPCAEQRHEGGRG